VESDVFFFARNISLTQQFDSKKTGDAAKQKTKYAGNSIITTERDHVAQEKGQSG
jgi:hypothetical protein